MCTLLCHKINKWQASDTHMMFLVHGIALLQWDEFGEKAHGHIWEHQSASHN